MINLNPAIWLVSYRGVNSIDHTAGNPIVKTIDNGFNRALLSFKHLEIFWHKKENIRNIQLLFVFLWPRTKLLNYDASSRES